MLSNNIDPEKIKIKLYFGGTEMKDEEEIYRYRIKDNNTVQLCKREISFD
jgi:hypothetical protein